MMDDMDADDSELHPFGTPPPPWPPPQTQSNEEAVRYLNAIVAADDLSGRPRPLDVWHNPLPRAWSAIFSTCRPGRTAEGRPTQKSTWITVTWQPGDRISLDRAYRRTMQLTRGGVIVAGVGMQLRREGSAIEMHPSVVPVSEEQALRDRTREEGHANVE